MFRFDLLEFLERSLRGFINSLRNILATIILLVRHPVRGPRVAEYRFRDPERRQIGGLTLLFLAFFFSLSLATIAGQSSLLDLPGRARQALAGSFNFQWSSIWPALAGSLVSTIVADFLLRAWLRTMSDLSGSERQVATEVVEYAFFIPAVLTSIWLLCVAAAEPMVSTAAKAAILIIASAVLYLAFLSSDRVLRAYAEAPSLRLISWPGRVLPFMTVVALALSFAAGLICIDLLRIRNQSPLVDSESVMDFVADAQCYSFPRDPKLYVLLTNWSDRPLWVDLARTTTALIATNVSRQGEHEVIVGHHVWLSQDGGPVVVEPGRSTVISATLPVDAIRQVDSSIDGRHPGRTGCFILRRYLVAASQVTITRPWRSQQGNAIGRNHVFTYGNGVVGRPDNSSR